MSFRRRNVRAVALVATLTVSAIVGSQADAAVVYLARSSSLEIQSCDYFGNCGPRTTQSTNGFEPFTRSVDVPEGRATQQSVIGTGDITVDTYVLTPMTGAINLGSSLFSLQFSLDVPTAFALNGSTAHVYDSARTTIRLTGPSTDISARYRDSGGSLDYFDVDAQGVLQPGVYTFYVASLTDGGPHTAVATARATLSLTPVPLPGALACLLPALLSLGFFRRESAQASAEPAAA